MTKRKLRKNAEINPPQSPHDGIHTCSKGCSKCSRGLRDTIEEQNQQIEALKRDVLEKTAELRKSEEHNDALCERVQDLNSELHTCSCANANMHKYKEENARLKAEVERLTLENSQYEEHHKYGQNVITSLREEVERLTAFTTRTIIPNEELQAKVERLTKAGDAWAGRIQAIYEGEFSGRGDWEELEAWNAAKEGKQP